MLAKRLLCFHPEAREDTNGIFLRFISQTGSDRNTVLGVFCYVPRDLSNGTWIIAIGHHSRKLGRQVCYSFCFSVTLMFTFFAIGYRPDFSTCEAEILRRQSPRSSLKTVLEIRGLGPP